MKTILSKYADQLSDLFRKLKSILFHPHYSFIWTKKTNIFIIKQILWLLNIIYILYKIVAPGTTVAAGIWNMHHNPEVWPEPWIYNPDRFLPENTMNHDSHCFLPFSAGPRNCMGQNFAMNLLRTVTARFLRKYTFIVDELQPFEVSLSTKIRPEEPGLFLYLSERKEVWIKC